MSPLLNFNRVMLILKIWENQSGARDEIRSDNFFETKEEAEVGEKEIGDL